jgi:hypothetical protein
MPDRELSTSDLARTVDAPAEDEESASEAEAVSGPVDERPGLDETSQGHPEADVERQAADTEPSDDVPGEPQRETGGAPSADHEPLLPADQSERFTARWQEIQASFVDQPRESVEQADALVADLMQRLAASFSNERQGLEAQWDRGDDVSTEDLRVALTRYRSFFDRLLSA